jgi:hypothetical protein
MQSDVNGYILFGSPAQLWWTLDGQDVDQIIVAPKHETSRKYEVPPSVYVQFRFALSVMTKADSIVNCAGVVIACHTRRGPMRSWACSFMAALASSVYLSKSSRARSSSWRTFRMPFLRVVAISPSTPRHSSSSVAPGLGGRGPAADGRRLTLGRRPRGVMGVVREDGPMNRNTHGDHPSAVPGRALLDS